MIVNLLKTIFYYDKYLVIKLNTVTTPIFIKTKYICMVLD